MERTGTKRTRRDRAVFFAGILLASFGFVYFLKQARGIPDAFAASGNHALFVTLFDILMTAALLGAALLCLPAVSHRTGIRLPKLAAGEKGYLAFLFVIYTFWALAFIHGRYGPDEVMRMDIPEFIFNHGYLPRGWEEEIRDPNWGVSYGFDISFPYLMGSYFMEIASLLFRPRAAVYYACRLSSILSMLGVAVLAMRISRRLFSSDGFRRVFTCSLTLLPQAVFLGSYFNLDSFSLFTAMLIFYAWIRCFETKWSPSSCALLGAGMGLCLISYKFAWGYLPASFCLYCLWSATHRKEYGWKRFLLRGILMVCVTLAVCGWSFLRNALLYNGDFLSLHAGNAWAEMYAADALKPSLKETVAGGGMTIAGMLRETDWIPRTVKSLIGVFGYMAIELDRWIYVVYLLLAGTGICGWILAAVLKRKGREIWWVIPGLVIGAAFAVGISVYNSWSWDYQPQGRYIITVLPLVCLLAAKGHESLCGLAEGKRWTGKLSRIAANCVCLYMLYTVFSGFLRCLSWYGYIQLF